jgi:hypothetical protein
MIWLNLQAAADVDANKATGVVPAQRPIIADDDQKINASESQCR